MLTQDILLQRFNEDTSGKNQMNGRRVFNNDLVSSVEITSEDELICIDGNVISENLFSEYHSKIEIDVKKKNVLLTYCTCADFEKNEFNKKNYCCKHLIATFYKALDELSKSPLLNEDDLEDELFKEEDSILDLLLDNTKHKDEIKIDVYINKNEWNDRITAEFKIGLKSTASQNLYVIKDIDYFLLAYNNNYPIKYSKNFTFKINKQKFTTKDLRLISFLETLKEMDERYRAIRTSDRNIDGKLARIPKYLVREFFEVIKNHRVFLNEGFFYRPVDTEILFQEPPIDFDLKIVKGDYILKSINGMPTSLSPKENVFLQGTTIYLPSYEFCFKVSPYLKVFSSSKIVTLPGRNEDLILRKLIPDLHLLSYDVTLSKKIKDSIVMEKVAFNFYFDKEQSKIILTVKVKYGAYEFNIFSDLEEKVVYRESKKEQQVIGLLNGLGFDEINGKFYMLRGDDYIFDFFKNEVSRLQDIGDVFYSQNFKGIKSLGAKGIKCEISPGKYDYLELKFKIGDIPPEESNNILRAFRDNLKYYKLKSGEYLNLEELELKNFLKILDAVSDDNIIDNNLEFIKSRAAYLSTFIEENSIRYLKGKKHLKDIQRKIKTLETNKVTIPENLNANLREYQKIGYQWFKNLDFLGFGGILGDEMGLGKTLQTISFILSNKNSKTLIVAPTSLVYNWLSEFTKFAPSVKVTTNIGNKDERELLLKNISNYDVIITTYNLVKRDIDLYKEIEFDYCILDEAQSIKNSHSQNAIAVKQLKTKSRFALSGTPIENSLMELWSIFDFIMPGYLYDEKRFSVRYHKKLKEDPVILEELNKLINPFILRRRKKDVIKELPDKIEKKLIVSLSDEQKKVYGTYSKYATDLIEKKVKDEEFKNSKIEILSYLTKLRQICLDPSVVMDNYIGNSGKIDALMEILHQSIEEGQKVLVFSQFTSVLKNIAKRSEIENIKYSYLDGSISAENRMKLVKDFNEGNNSVFFISLKAGGTGLNLTSASIVIHFDPWWNPAVEDQATDRAHRIGQKNVVEVIKLIAKGTIEEKVVALQEEKKELISKLMGDELGETNTFNNLTEEEILDLFKIDFL